MTKELLNDLQENTGLTEADAIAVYDYVSHQAQISGANLQLKFKLGYNKAGKILEQLEKHNVVSDYDGFIPRSVLINKKGQ